MFHRTPQRFLPVKSASWPALCSADFQIRLKAAQLPALQWTHLDTSLQIPGTPASHPGCALEGITEWTTHHQGKCLTLGWDWVLCHDGQLLASTGVPPRSNLQLLDPAGYDLDHHANAQGLQQLAEMIPWQREVSEWIGRQGEIPSFF